MTNYHSKWWRMTMWSLLVHTVIWDLSNFSFKRRYAKVTVLLAVAKCSVVQMHHYRWSYCFHLLSWWKQRYLRNVGAVITHCRTSHTRRQQSWWEQHISQDAISSPPWKHVFYKAFLIKLCVIGHCSLLFVFCLESTGQCRSFCISFHSSWYKSLSLVSGEQV